VKAEGARFYDNLWEFVFKERKSSKRRAWERMKDLARAASKEVVGSVLDWGCGFGFLSEFVRGPYLGVDFSPFVIKTAKGLHPEAEFLVGDIRDFQSPDMFDTVVMLEVLEHLDDPHGAVESARKLARKRIVISVPRGKSRSGDHVWKDIDREDVLELLGEGATCQQYRRKWLGVWEDNAIKVSV